MHKKRIAYRNAQTNKYKKMINLNKLNGWQRLFIVVSVTWLAVCINLASKHFPTESELIEENVKARSSDFAEHYAQIEAIKAKCDESNFSQDDNTGSLICGFKNAEKVHQLNKENESFDKQRSAVLKEQFDELPRKQAAIILKTIILWVIPSLLVYFVVPWLISGFRKTE